MPTIGRSQAADNSDQSPSNEVSQALDLMERALRLLDEHAGPSDAGAHLDLAIHRLREWIDNGQD